MTINLRDTSSLYYDISHSSDLIKCSAIFLHYSRGLGCRASILQDKFLGQTYHVQQAPLKLHFPIEIQENV